MQLRLAALAQLLKHATLTLDIGAIEASADIAAGARPVDLPLQ
jgi:hypothetical protein